MRDPHVRSQCANGHQEPVFVAVTEFVECPDGVIPSLVCIEPSKERPDLRANVFTSPLYHSVQVSSCVGNGEVGVFRLDGSSDDSCCISRLVQGRPKRLQGFSGEVSPTIGEIACELKRVSCNAFSIHVLDTLVWFLFKEGCDTFLKPSRVFLSTVKSALRALEGIDFSSHG